MSSDAENQFSSITRSDCDSVAPGATCTIQLTAKSTASSSPFPTDATIQGSNTNTASTTLAFDSGVSAADVSFSEPGGQSLVLLNNADVPVTINQVQFTSNSISNVTIGSIPSSCDSLAPGNSCSVPLTAIADSHGSGIATISYTRGTQSLTTTANVSVASTTVSINSDNEIRLDPNQASQVVVLDNTGNFNWQNPLVELASELTNTTIVSNTCSEKIAVGDSCQLSFTTTGATIAQSTTLDATGNNIVTTHKNVTIDGGLTVEPDTDAANTHLYYRAVKVENLTPDNAQLTDVTISGLDNEVSFCPSGDTDCDFTSTCQLNTDIASEDSCLLWFKGETPSTGGVVGADSGTITVTGTTDTGSTSTTLDAAYELDLYVGGTFTSAANGSVTANDIAYFNGTNWNAMIVGEDNGVTSSPNTFTTYQGDLYSSGLGTAGGLVTTGIAYWNGDSRHNLGDGVDGTVVAMTVINNILYVGGSFTEAGGSSANRVAAWNGSSWSALGSGVENTVRALIALGTTIYAGGDFTTAGGSTANRVAAWDGSNWSAAGSGVNMSIYALNGLEPATLYAVGKFTYIVGTGQASRVAVFKNDSWNTVPSTGNQGVGGTASAVGIAPSLIITSQ